ncbi:flagellar basal body-associated FliL family protein [Sphingomonas sp. MMS24-J45]|uniref:flagellar basal body-associated FliL family protein n=1 Tax=Sphingomonas sp. MMS24-J45 TaxID=3238806 RepID=UPI00384E035A
MAEPQSDSEIAESPAEDGAVPAKKSRFSKKIMIIAGGITVLLIVAGVLAAMFLFKGEAKGEEAAAGEHAAAPAEGGHGEGAATYIDAPAMVVNLRGADGTARFLKIRFTLVPESAGKVEEIKAKLPAVVDAFQPFLRELRPEDLAGSAAVFRIKEEMLVRANGALGPGEIKDILIQDLIQQ